MLALVAILVVTVHPFTAGQAQAAPPPLSAPNATCPCCAAAARATDGMQSSCRCYCPKCPASDEHPDACPQGCVPGAQTGNANPVMTFFQLPAALPTPHDLRGFLVDAAVLRPPSAALEGPLRPPRI